MLSGLQWARVLRLQAVAKWTAPLHLAEAQGTRTHQMECNSIRHPCSHTKHHDAQTPTWCDAAAQKRTRYEAFLKSVSILKDMTSYELSQIADALKSEDFAADSVIVKQVTAFPLLDSNTKRN